MFGLFRDDLRWTGENWKYIYFGEPTEGSFNILCWKLKFLWFLNTDIKNIQTKYYNIIIPNFMFPQSDFFTKAYPKTGFNGTQLCAMSYWWKSFTFGSRMYAPDHHNLSWRIFTQILYFSVNFSLEKLVLFVFVGLVVWEDDGTENTAFKQIPIMKNLHSLPSEKHPETINITEFQS